jgi:hypothetical protein
MVVGMVGVEVVAQVTVRVGLSGQQWGAVQNGRRSGTR